MKQPLKIAVIGVGYLGKFHAQKYASLPNAELTAVCDVDKNQCDHIAQQYGCQAIYDYRGLLGAVDAVSIAVPTTLHYCIAKDFLTHGTHVLLEKPITETVAEAQELNNIAAQKGLVLQVGHLERFNSVVHALTHILDRPQFIESFRLAPFQQRGNDVNVILDLMIHDIDLIKHIVQSPIVNIDANGASVLSNYIDIANARITFANQCVANVTASRISFKKERKLRIFQPDAYICVDLQDKQLAYHKKSGIENNQPKIITEQQVFEQGDALKDEIIAFLDSIIHQKPPVISGEEAQDALATAIEITRIISAQHG